MSPRVGERAVLVTDRRLADPARQIDAALAGVPAGSVLVQLREKDLDGRALLELARALRDVTRRRGARLLVNDRLDVALAADADGVHLPDAGGLPVAAARALLGPDRLVGASAHAPATAAARAAEGADLVTFGPVWATPSKARHGPPQGVEALAEAVAAVAGRAAVFAIGGVDDAGRAARAAAAGASGVAVIRAVMAAADAAAATAALLAAMVEGRA